MTPIKCKWYPVSELAEEWNCSIKKILHYGASGGLQLSTLAPSQNDPGPYPLSKEDALKLWENFPVWKGYLTELKSWSFPTSLYSINHVNKLTVCMENIVVTHEEKIRFEKEYNRKTEMGNRERENLLRLIGALISQHYHGDKYIKSTDGSFNASTISQDLRAWLKKNNFLKEGMSNRSLREWISRAYDLIKENKTTK